MKVRDSEGTKNNDVKTLTGKGAHYSGKDGKANLTMAKNTSSPNVHENNLFVKFNVIWPNKPLFYSDAEREVLRKIL